MPEQSEKTSIELLPEKKFEEYPLAKKITAWVVSIGRVVIIITELIAFSVFVGRIKLDRQLTDLTDALENQLIILQNAQGFEGEFKDLQERLEIIKELRRGQVTASQTASLLSALLPQNVELTGLTIEPEAEKSYLLAKTNSATGFARAINNLKSSSRIKDIALTSGRFSAKDGTYNFSLAIMFAKEK